MSIRELILIRLCDEIAESVEACSHLGLSTFDHPQDRAWKQYTAVVGMVAYPTPLLADVVAHTALSGVLVRLLRIQRHLLAMLASEKEIDCERACRVLQHLHGEGGYTWSARTSKLARELQFDLTRTPRECSHGMDLPDVDQPRRAKA